PRIIASIFNVTSPRKGDVINFTANATDDTALDTCIFYMNGTTGGIFKVENESFPTQPTSGQCSQNWTIDLIRGNVINFTTVVNDTSTNVAGGNLNQSEQIITVADFIATVSIGINNSAPKINEVINVSSNTTDLDNLAWCLIKHNGTADGSFTNNTFELSGTDGFCSDPISITLVRGNVINFTIEINDSLGGIIYENSTKVTVTNTPAPQASIIFPPDDFKTNKLPLDLNVTFAADPDNDVINITYYIDGKINQTQIELNTTFNASDGVYILNVSLHDNVIPVEYSINVTINFTIDTVVPVVNTSLNQTTNIGFGDVINLTANVTDGVDLSFCQIIINQSGPNDLEFINISLSGTTGQCSKSSTVTLVGGNVINYTIRVNDTAGNFRTNDTIITVVDKIAPVINGTLNKSLSNILQNDVINVSFNATDEIELSDGTIIINETGFNRYFNFSLEGKTAAGFSQNFTINCTAGCVINVTGRVNDTSGNIKQNETIFTVTEEEIPPGTTTTTTTTGGGGGGGARGGGIVLPKKDFSVDLNTIKSSILQGETKTTTLRVKNTGGTKLQFSVEIQNLGKFIEVSDDSFELGPDESKTITFSFTASENELPDVYSGKIVIKADGIEKSIITIIEVTERKALFDVSIAVDKNYKKVLKDQEVKIDIDLTNLGTLAPVDVELFYAIKDLDENIIVFKTESLAVNDRLTVSRSLQIPNDLEVGKYIVYVRVLYNDQIAASSDLFEVVDILPGLGGLGAIKTIGTIVLALVLLLLVINGLYYSDILREQQREQLQRKVQEFLAKRKEKIITRPKERVLETKEGLQILLEKPKQKISKVMETIKVVPRKTPEQRIISEKELEIRKISSQIEEWEKKGYDSTMLELEIKALEDKELGKQIEKLKEWKSKGYNTFILEEKIKNNYKKDLMRK
ncbi:MAG: hypothetical protein IIC69_00720, partial [Nanoarchaeota archaeon]|nr:hypothetical protein [Nanoarchaeota archaeon]